MQLKNALLLSTLYLSLASADFIPRTKVVPRECPSGATLNGTQCCTTNPPTCQDAGLQGPLEPCPQSWFEDTINGERCCCRGKRGNGKDNSNCIRRGRKKPTCPTGYTLDSTSKKCCQPTPDTCTDKPADACPANYFACGANYFGDCCPNGDYCGTQNGAVGCWT